MNNEEKSLRITKSHALQFRDICGANQERKQIHKANFHRKLQAVLDDFFLLFVCLSVCVRVCVTNRKKYFYKGLRLFNTVQCKSQV